MAGITVLTGLYRRLLRSRFAVFLGMAAVAYALANSGPTRAAAVNSACATANYTAYFDSLPFGRVFNDPVNNSNCQPCHTVNTTGSARTNFGLDYIAQAHVDLVSNDFVHAWTISLATTDTDSDGYTNGEELQDPQGLWHNGDPDLVGGVLARVTNPNDSASVPSAPTISQLVGVTSGGTIQSLVTLQVQLNTTVGARSVLYEVLDGSSQVVQSFNQTSGGVYTSLASTFDHPDWDTNNVVNGTYTVRATLTDATGLLARKSVKTVTNVLVNNPARAVRYVAAGGANTGGCTSSAAPCGSLGYAVGQAQNNDEIRIAAGTYPVGSGSSPLSVGVRVSLRGGYAVGFQSAPNPAAYVTILSGQRVRPALAFTAGATGFSVSGLTIANGSGSLGGGAALAGATGSFSQVIFSANHSSSNGGALAVNSAGGATLSRVSFLGNTASVDGGAIYSQAGLTMTNVVFGRNSAAQGGAIALSGTTSSSITYATIAGAARPEEAIYLGGVTHTLALANSLISGYATGVAMDVSAGLTLQNTLIANNVTTTTSGGSVTGSPLRGIAGFVNAAADDYRPAFGAPAIDAGAATPAIAKDRDGNPRPSALPGDATSDIGAYEFQGPVGALFFPNISLNVPQPTSVAITEARLSVASVSAVTVHYATTDGTALSGVDYTAASGDLTFAPGETSKMIHIPVLSPSPAATLPRSFSIRMSAASGAALGTFSFGTITLLPPPDPPRVTLSVTGAEASRRGPHIAIVTFERDVVTNTPLVVSYTLGGDAKPGVDYAPLSGTITFPAGALTTTVRVEPVGGTGVRLVTVTLEPGSAYLLGRTSVTVRISGSFVRLSFLPLLRR